MDEKAEKRRDLLLKQTECLGQLKALKDAIETVRANNKAKAIDILQSNFRTFSEQFEEISDEFNKLCD